MNMRHFDPLLMRRIEARAGAFVPLELTFLPAAG
jgi:hypothetical protein